MFTHNYRLIDRYNREVASLAVLADDNPPLAAGPVWLWPLGLAHRHPLSDGEVVGLRRGVGGAAREFQPLRVGGVGAPRHAADAA